MPISRTVFLIFGIVALAFVPFLLRLLRRVFVKTVPVQRLETLSLSDVVSLFSSDVRRAYLKVHPDCQATVLRQELDGDGVDVKVCIYDCRKHCVIELLAHYHVDALAEDLLSVFGQKDMLILH